MFQAFNFILISEPFIFAENVVLSVKNNWLRLPIWNHFFRSKDF